MSLSLGNTTAVLEQFSKEIYNLVAVAIAGVVATVLKLIQNEFNQRRTEKNRKETATIYTSAASSSSSGSSTPPSSDAAVGLDKKKETT